jgi:hypothetical protein
MYTYDLQVRIHSNNRKFGVRPTTRVGDGPGARGRHAERLSVPTWKKLKGVKRYPLLEKSDYASMQRAVSLASIEEK